MIADDNIATRENIKKLLGLESDVEVTCEAATGEEAVRKAFEMLPDVILMDINMPGMDGITATEEISAELPQCMILVVSVQGEQEYLRKAMSAGAKEFLVKPFEGNELLGCIRHIYAREQKRRKKFESTVQATTPQNSKLGKVVTIFSTKGGIGKTTIATNLGAALGFDPANKVCILDVDLQFGDVGLFLNIVPKVTIADLVKDFGNLDSSMLEKYLSKYSDNVKVLAAPARPEQADDVTAAHLVAIIKQLQYTYDYIIIDTAPLFNDITFNILEMSNTILVATSQDLPTLKNVKLCLEIFESLQYPAEKIKVILNRADSIGGMTIQDSESLLRRKFLSSMPSDGRTVVTAVNQGVPFIISKPDVPVAQTILRLTNYIISGNEEYSTAPNRKTHLSRKDIITKNAPAAAAPVVSSDKKPVFKEEKKSFLSSFNWSVS
jgi:pilus assembly protein CpaE